MNGDQAADPQLLGRHSRPISLTLPPLIRWHCACVAVLEADTLPQIFTGQKGPDTAHGGCYL